MQTYAGESRRNGYDFRHKKIGSKSKRCTLPSDYMTPAQRKEMSSKVSMHNVNRPISYGLFRELDAESKNEYLTYLVNTYNATGGAIAEMLGCSKNTFYRVTRGLPCTALFKKGKYMHAGESYRWNKFLQGRQTDPFADHEQEQTTQNAPSAPPTSGSNAVPPPPVVITVHQDAAKTVMQRFCMTFVGDVDVMAVAERLRAMVGENNISRLEISCEL